MFGCCGFLSFSLVFCLLGGRLETTLYIHFIRHWVETRRHSSVLRRKKRERKGGKERHSSQLAALWGVCGVYQQACPVDHLRLAYVLDKPSLAEGVYRLFAAAPLTTSTAPISAKRSSLRRVKSSVRRKSPTLLCLHRYSATVSTSLSIRRRRVGRAEAAGVRLAVAVLKWTPVYIAGDGCNSSSGLTHLPPPVEPKAKPPARL